MSAGNAEGLVWPDISYPAWRDTCSALHLWCQIVGKYRLAHTPWVNHSWHATLYVTPRGLSTGPVPDPKGNLSLTFDFCDHSLVAEMAGGARSSVPLEAMSVADFFKRTKNLIAEVGGTPTIQGSPNEIPDAKPFAEDDAQRPYDAAAVERYHQALLRISDVFSQYRTAFIGKVSPVHLFWGSFDLAVTRFSGRDAPLHPGGIPALPDSVTREAYSHEVSSAGFWPGGGGIDAPTFYAYAYPGPKHFSDATVMPSQAEFNNELGEFVLSYDSVRHSPNPAAALMEFLQSTYAAAADLGDWDRDHLECAVGEPRRPRPPFNEK